MGLGARTAVGLSVIAVAAVPIAGCGGNEAQSARALRATTRTLAFGADQSVPGTSLARAAQLLDQSVQEGQAFRGSLDRLANSPDPFGALIADALCTGMTQMANSPDITTALPQDEWRDFLVEQVNILAPGNPASLVQQKVNGVLATLNLAQVDPRLAQIYARECVARAR